MSNQDIDVIREFMLEGGDEPHALAALTRVAESLAEKEAQIERLRTNMLLARSALDWSIRYVDEPNSQRTSLHDHCLHRLREARAALAVTGENTP